MTALSSPGADYHLSKMRKQTAIAAAIAALAGLVFVATASAQLELSPRGESLFRVTGEGDADRERAFVARQGDRYRFQVDYEVEGADEIGTAHTFIFENATTGERVDVATESFPPEPPGQYNEASTNEIPETWEPGVYLFRWEVTARNPSETSVEISGVESFLLLPG